MMHADSTGFDDFDSIANYEYVVGPEFPPDGSWGCDLYAFDRDGKTVSEFVARWGAPTIVRVAPVNGPEWVGMYAAGGLGPYSGVFATPSPNVVCVVAGGLAYLTNVERPGDGTVIANDGVVQAMAAREHDLLLLATFVDFVAVGADGARWRSHRLIVDDLRMTRVVENGIECTGDLLDREPSTFVVDLRTGAVVSGPRLDWPSGAM